MARKKGKVQFKSERQDHKRELSDDQFEELMAQSFQPVKDISVGDRVEATIIGFDNEHIFLDLGTRLDGVVKKAEYTVSGELSVLEGDVIEVYVNGRKGGVWLCSGRLGSADGSGQKTRQTAALMMLEDAFNKNTPVEGQVKAVTKGGFEVEVLGVKAFCPISQIDRAYCENPDIHVDQLYTFEIIRFEEDGDNVVVSRKEYLNHQAAKEAEKLWEKLEVDAVYEGKITAVRDFGAFVDIGGIEGLLHISEISYKRLDKAGDALAAGETIKVSIKSIDHAMKKVSFSRKSLLDDPWVEAVKKLSEGTELKGKVVRMKTFGAFIELFPGVDGMVHISRLGSDRRHQHPKEVLEIGQMVDVRVLEIDMENRRISLTMEKEEKDFSKDLEKLKKDQEDESQSSTSHMANLFDQAMNKE